MKVYKVKFYYREPCCRTSDTISFLISVPRSLKIPHINVELIQYFDERIKKYCKNCTNYYTSHNILSIDYTGELLN